MAASFKVTYFDITALGEPIRYLLSYGNLDFEDNRIAIEKWPSLKPKTPFGQLPTLEHDGKIANQGMDICRFLAKKCKLVGRNDWDDLKIDAAVSTINDFRLAFADYYYEPNDELKEQKRKALFGKTVPFYLDRLEKQVQENSGYLAVSYLTWADIVYAALMEYINFMAGVDIILNYPNLKTLVKRISTIPNIKKWLETRPKKTQLNPKYFNIQE